MGRFASFIVSTATATAGLTAGALLFVSAVDVRALLKLAHKPNGSRILKDYFAEWWPAGRDFMVPLIAANAVTHSIALLTTGEKCWLMSGACISAIGPYTVVLLGEDIEALRAADDKDTVQVATRFCHLHHVRTALAGAAFGMAISAARRTN